MAALNTEPTVAPTWGTGAPPPMPSEPPQRNAEPAIPPPAPTPAPAPQQVPSATPAVVAQNATPSATTQAVPTAPVQPVAASEPIQPKAEIARPILDPRPLKYLEMYEPKKFELVKQIANDAGISPERLAAHWHSESGFGTDTNLRNKEGSGAMGPLQIMPDTAKYLSQNGKFDVNKFVDHMRMGANYMREGDDKYGRDTVSSVAYYQGGPGSVNSIIGEKGRAEQNHPNTFKYLRQVFAGQNITPDMFIGDGKMTPQGVLRSGVEGGHEGFIQYIAQGAPAGMPLSDAWQHAEALLVKSFLMRNDVAGAQHARDFVLQMSHTGSNQYLMGAHQALSAGDAVGAAQLLAKAHAFFPDGTAGQFGITGNGEVWGMRVDEHDSKRVLSKFKITPDHIAAMLNQTANPQQYLKTLNEQQKVAIEGRKADTLGAHYKVEEEQGAARIAAENARLVESQRQHGITEANQTRRGDQADARAAAELEQRRIANEHAAQQLEFQRRTQDRADQVLKDNEDKAKLAELQKEVTTLYGPDASDVGSQPARARAAMADVHTEVRKQGANPVGAESIAKGLQGKDSPYQLARQPDGRFGVVPRTKGGAPGGAPLYYISPGLGARLMPPTPDGGATKKPAALSVAVP